MSRLNRRGRALDGILLVDKPLGVSSHGVVQACRWLYGAAKAGHTGCLDPKASGMLPICFGEATKFAAHHLLDANKQYTAEATLGARSTTGDLEGELFDQRPIPQNLAEILPGVLDEFCGEIDQVPPMHSALKVDGTPLYKLACAGRTVEREKRRVNIDKLELVSVVKSSLKFRISCSKGTYIRTLIEDLGEALGCGAHTTFLHREWVEPFEGLAMQDPDVIEEMAKTSPGYNKPEMDALLIPVDSALKHLPGRQLLDDGQLEVFCSGNPVSAIGVEDCDTMRVYCPYGMFLGLGYCKQETLKPLRLIARKTDL